MMKSLKTILCLMALAVVTPVCSQEKDNNPWPWDFPQSVKLKLEAGQTVLSPFTYYPSSVEKGEPLRKSVLIFYDTTVNTKENVLSGNYRERILELAGEGYPLIFHALDYMNRPFGFNCYYYRDFIVTD